MAIGNKLTDTVPNAIATVTPIPIPANNTTTFTGANYVVDGGIDSPVDYYRFRTAPAANSTDRPLLRVQLDDLFGNLDIEVVSLGVDGQPIPGRGGISDASSRSPSGTFGQGSEDFSGILSPDTEYIIRIFAPNGSGEGSTYNLTVDLAVASDIPAKTRGIRPGGESSNPRNVTEVGNFTFFSAEDGSEPSSPNSLWRTDTTIDGTQKFGDFVSLGNFTAAGNSGNNTLLYFVANDGTPNLGNDLFKCDPNGVISRVRDGDDPILSSYADLTAVGDRLYFLAEAGTGTGRRLYRTGVDGTGVELVLTAGGAEILGTRVRDLTAVGDDALFFDGRFGADGSQLAYIQNARTANNTPTEIFLTSTNPPEAVDPNDLVAVSANTLYFTAEPSTLDRKLYRYTIGDAQPTLVSLGGIAPNPGNLIFVEGTSSPNTLYFTADTIDTSSNPVGEELVRIVNPASSTTAELVSNITPDAGSSDIAGLVALDGTGRLAFITIDPADNLSKVWVTDGTDAGTRAITLTGNITEYNPSPTQLAAVGGTIFFAADTPTEGRELWKYDTDATNTLATLVGDINTTDDPSNPDVVPNSNPGSFAVANDTLLFTADDGVDGIELWSVLP
ncbi:MAG: hypothetical protein HC769_08415 [Cyanobacteria bacterium CRU_2_1]|nr:hypothetical protein [Cyanobacteria bacterium CRU_2_1]